MEWTVYDFECGDAAARESMVAWFERAHPLAVPDDDHVHGSLVDDAGAETPADLAWIAEYVYVLTSGRVSGLLADSADHWERAVAAEFDADTETCTEAVLYHAEGGGPVERARYEGVSELAGQGLLYRFAMDHQFRFRTFAHAPPAPMITPTYGAFDAVVGAGWGSEAMESLEAATGVSPTGEGLAFLEDDPVLAEGEFYDVDESA